MQYLSPATYLGEALSGPLDKKAIQLGRKKLFAELELSGGSTIDVQGKPFTKNDIIHYFEDLLKEDALTYHSAIGEDPVLLTFLEHAQMGRKEKLRNNPLYNNESFIQWVSPYFCNSFITFIDACFLVEANEDGLASLMNNRLLMTGADLEKCWNAISRIIMNDISMLERFYEQGRREKVSGDVTLGQARDLMEFQYIRLIQLLPQGRFAVLRDKYALCMQNACINAFNKYPQYRSYVKTWMENAILLAVSPEVKSQLSRKLSEMESIGTPAPSAAAPAGQKKKEASPLKFIIIGIILLIKIATCKSNFGSSSYNYRTTPSYNIPQQNVNRQEMDSLIKLIRAGRLGARQMDRTDTMSAYEQSPASVAPMDTVTFTHKIPRRSGHK